MIDTGVIPFLLGKKKRFQNRPSINLPQKRTKTKNTIVHVEEFAKKCLVTENSYTVQTCTQSWSLAGTTAVTTFKYIYIQKPIRGKMMLNISFNEILPENISLAIKHDAFHLKVHSVGQRCKKQVFNISIYWNLKSSSSLSVSELNVRCDISVCSAPPHPAFSQHEFLRRAEKPLPSRLQTLKKQTNSELHNTSLKCFLFLLDMWETSNDSGALQVAVGKKKKKSKWLFFWFQRAVSECGCRQAGWWS